MQDYIFFAVIRNDNVKHLIAICNAEKQIGKAKNAGINTGAFFHLKSTYNVVGIFLKPQHINEFDGSSSFCIGIDFRKAIKA